MANNESTNSISASLDQYDELIRELGKRNNWLKQRVEGTKSALEATNAIYAKLAKNAIKYKDALTATVNVYNKLNKDEQIGFSEAPDLSTYLKQVSTLKNDYAEISKSAKDIKKNSTYVSKSVSFAGSSSSKKELKVINSELEKIIQERVQYINAKIKPVNISKITQSINTALLGTMNALARVNVISKDAVNSARDKITNRAKFNNLNDDFKTKLNARNVLSQNPFAVDSVLGNSYTGNTSTLDVRLSNRGVQSENTDINVTSQYRGMAEEAAEVSSENARVYTSLKMVANGLKAVSIAINVVAVALSALKLAFNLLSTIVKKVASILGTAFNKLVDLGKKMIAAGKSAYTQNQKLKESAIQLGEGFDSAYKYAQKLNNEVGTNIKSTIITLGELANELKGLGMSETGAEEFAEHLVDVAKNLYNSGAYAQDYATILEDVKSAYIDGSNAMDKYGFISGEKALNTWALVKEGINTANVSLTDYARTQLNRNMLDAEYFDLMQGVKSENDEMAFSIQNIKNQWEDMLDLLNEIFLPVFKAVQSVLKGITNSLHDLVSAIHTVTGTTAESVVKESNAQKIRENASKSAALTITRGYIEQTEALQKYQNQLFSFDEVIGINRLLTSSDVSQSDDNDSNDVAPNLADDLESSGTFNVAVNMNTDGIDKSIEDTGENAETVANKTMKDIIAEWKAGIEDAPGIISKFEELANAGDSKGIKKLWDSLTVPEKIATSWDALRANVKSGSIDMQSAIEQLIYSGIQVVVGVENIEKVVEALNAFLLGDFDGGLELIKEAAAGVIRNGLENLDNLINYVRENFKDELVSIVESLFTLILDVMLDALNDYKSKFFDPLLNLINTVITAAGAIAGAIAGGVIGSVGGPLGTVAGAAIGGTVGGFASGGLTLKAENKLGLLGDTFGTTINGEDVSWMKNYKASKASKAFKSSNSSTSGSISDTLNSRVSLYGKSGFDRLASNVSQIQTGANDISNIFGSLVPSYDNGGIAITPHLAQIGTSAGEVAIPLGSSAAESFYNKMADSITDKMGIGSSNYSDNITVNINPQTMFTTDREMKKLAELMTDEITRIQRDRGVMTYGTR